MPRSSLSHLSQRLRAAARAFDGALAASAAVEGGRRPSPAALEALGIDPRAFGRIGRR